MGNLIWSIYRTNSIKIVQILSIFRHYLANRDTFHYTNDIEILPNEFIIKINYFKNGYNSVYCVVSDYDSIENVQSRLSHFLKRRITVNCLVYLVIFKLFIFN